MGAQASVFFPSTHSNALGRSIGSVCVHDGTTDGSDGGGGGDGGYGGEGASNDGNGSERSDGGEGNESKLPEVDVDGHRPPPDSGNHAGGFDGGEFFSGNGGSTESAAQTRAETAGGNGQKQGTTQAQAKPQGKLDQTAAPSQQVDDPVSPEQDNSAPGNPCGCGDKGQQAIDEWDSYLDNLAQGDTLRAINNFLRYYRDIGQPLDPSDYGKQSDH